MGYLGFRFPNRLWYRNVLRVLGWIPKNWDPVKDTWGVATCRPFESRRDIIKINEGSSLVQRSILFSFFIWRILVLIRITSSTLAKERNFTLIGFDKTSFTHSSQSWNDCKLANLEFEKENYPCSNLNFKIKSPGIATLSFVSRQMQRYS